MKYLRLPHLHVGRNQLPFFHFSSMILYITSQSVQSYVYIPPFCFFLYVYFLRVYLCTYITTCAYSHPTANLATYHPAIPPTLSEPEPRKLHPKIKSQAQITFYGIKIIKCNGYENYSDTRSV